MLNIWLLIRRYKRNLFIVEVPGTVYGENLLLNAAIFRQDYPVSELLVRIMRQFAEIHFLVSLEFATIMC
jgi:hypothetical protein